MQNSGGNDYGFYAGIAAIIELCASKPCMRKGIITFCNGMRAFELAVGEENA